MKKKVEALNRPEVSDPETCEEDDSETDEAVRLFKQKIRRLEKAAKAGQLDVSEKVEDGGGVWLNNLDSLNNLDPKAPSITDSERKKITFPGLGMNSPNIVMPPPLEDYESRINELVKKEQKNQEEMLKISNEDNVLMQISSVVDLSQIGSTESITATAVPGPKSGIRLVQSTARDIAAEGSVERKTAENVPREMLLTRRGYQVKKLENSKAGFSKKVRHSHFSLNNLLHYLIQIVLLTWLSTLFRKMCVCMTGVRYRHTHIRVEGGAVQKRSVLELRDEEISPYPIVRKFERR